MNRINTIFIIIESGVAVFIMFLVMASTSQANLTAEKMKLIKGESETLRLSTINQSTT